jgi:UDP-N-acetylglucosamine 2-epimerase
MFDAVLYYRDLAMRSIPLERFAVRHNAYVLCTLHRRENIDSIVKLSTIFRGLNKVAQTQPVLIPLHPGTRARCIREFGMDIFDGLTILDPLPYLEMQRLQMSAHTIITDSGGIQKEAYFHKVPCITLREETEWIETVESGWNRLSRADDSAIYEAFIQRQIISGQVAGAFGDGSAAEKILAKLKKPICY